MLYGSCTLWHARASADSSKGGPTVPLVPTTTSYLGTFRAQQEYPASLVVAVLPARPCQHGGREKQTSKADPPEPQKNKATAAKVKRGRRAARRCNRHPQPVRVRRRSCAQRHCCHNAVGNLFSSTAHAGNPARVLATHALRR